MATQPSPFAGLRTHVLNTSGSEKAFGFLGKHGRRLAANEQITIPGDLRQTLSAHTRKFKALERCLDAGALTIVKTPAPLLYDAEDDNTKELRLDNATLGITDPEWGAYSSSGQSPYT
jgi:hypothetical protein